MEQPNRIQEDGRVWWVYYNGHKAARCWSRESAKRVLRQLIATGFAEE